MKLSAGDHLGAYRIEKYLTSGGMGEVYLALHEHLERRVAIKILGGAIAGDPVAVQRFRREARAASTLSHPHICTLYDFCQQDGLSFLVLEYLDGTTLETCLKQRRLTLVEAARIGAELAEALDHAHSRGFVHRDLKPANVMLTQDAGAKVLDFGLVARSPARFAAANGRLGGNDAPNADLTAEGTLVGTVPYMAPEQIQGGAVDARTDIYALGTLLYEMVTGSRAFEGRTPLELAVAIVQADPVPVAEREPDTPDLLVRLIERCMARSADDRWQSARDVAAELRWLSSRRHSSVRRQARDRLPSVRIGAAVVVLLGAGLLAGTLIARATNGSVGDGATAYAVTAPAGVTFTESSRSIPALSPNGTRILFVGTNTEGLTHLYVKEPESLEPSVLPRTEGAILPFWGPDGRSIGYFANGQLMVLPADGGPPVGLGPASLEARGGSWSRDDVIIYSPDPRRGILAVPAGGGELRELTAPDRARGEIGHLWPRFLPDGVHFVYFVSADTDSARGVYVASLDGGIAHRVVSSVSSAAFGSGHLLYVRGNALLAEPFDTRRLVAGGSPRIIDEHVLTTHTFAGGFSVSADGDLAFWSGDTKDVTRLRWFDRSGRPLDFVAGPAHQRNPSLSRDGRYLAMEQYSDGDGDIVITDLATGRTSRQLSPSIHQRNAVWSPDGRSIAFVAELSDGWAIYRRELDTTQESELLLHSDTELMATDWSPDGSTLLYANRKASGDYDLYALPLLPGARSQPLIGGASPNDVGPIEAPRNDAYEVSGRFSPSGRWIAYGSSESGRLEIYIQPYPATGLRCQISDHGGYDPHWGVTDGEIYYLSPSGELMAVELRASDRCPADAPRLLFRTPVATPGAARNHYAFAPGTGAFLFNAPAADPATWTISMILDWPAALSRPVQ